ncbi:MULTISPECIES: hypothetical protein [unclassified Streptomyces]|uniref:hypothetical protein n=1 Tax=unclassified Streptomyces TaxID=2593676 RepID=UPI000AC49308|nr:hypothetical protein [Streptomyces sp. TSRI0107]
MPTAPVIGRWVAAFVSLGTFANLLVRGVEDMFVVPDVLVGVVLAVAAGLPKERAAPLLASAFGLASGVFTVAASAHVVHDENPAGVLVFASVCAAMTVVLSRRVGAGAPRRA